MRPAPQTTARLADLRAQIRSLDTKYLLAESEHSRLESFVFTGGSPLGALIGYIAVARRRRQPVRDRAAWDAIQHRKRVLARRMADLGAVSGELREREREVAGVAWVV